MFIVDLVFEYTSSAFKAFVLQTDLNCDGP